MEAAEAADEENVALTTHEFTAESESSRNPIEVDRSRWRSPRGVAVALGVLLVFALLHAYRSSGPLVSFASQPHVQRMDLFAVPMADCPFSNIDIVLIVIPKDFPLLAFLFQSLDAMMPCYGYLHLVMDSEGELSRLRSYVRVHSRVRFHVMFVPPELNHIPGKIAQAWYASWSDRIVSATAEYVMWTDTDSVFGMPLTCRSIFDDFGRPYQLYWSFARSGQWFFEGPCQVHLSPPNRTEPVCIGSFMAFFPMIYPVKMFPGFRRTVTRNLNASFGMNCTARYPTRTATPVDALPPTPIDDYDCAFASWSHAIPGQVSPYSQFVILSNYLVRAHPDWVHPIFYPDSSELLSPRDDEAMAYIPTAQHYGWQYCDFTHACRDRTNWRADAVSTRLSKKYTFPMIAAAEQIIRHARCLRDWLRDGAGNSETNRVSSADCLPEYHTDVHRDIKPYQDRAANMKFIAERYTPEQLPLPACPFKPTPPAD